MDTLDYEKAREEGEKRANAFLNYLIVASNIDSIKPAKFDELPKLLNAEKFKEDKKIVTKTFSSSFLVVNTLRKERVDSANLLSSTQHRLTSDKQGAIDTCLFWLRRAAEAEFTLERFVFRWVSFEALGGVLNARFNSTEKQIHCLINELTEKSANAIFSRHSELVKQLEVASLIGWKGQNRNQELTDAIQALARSGSFKTVMMRTASCIYEVRNRFLHKGIAESLVNSCSVLLKELIHAVLRDYLLRDS